MFKLGKKLNFIQRIMNHFEVGVLKARIKGALERVKCHYSDRLYKENELNLFTNDQLLFDTIVVKSTDVGHSKEGIA